MAQREEKPRLPPLVITGAGGGAGTSVSAGASSSARPTEGEYEPFDASGAPAWLAVSFADGERLILLTGPSLWLVLLRRPRLHIICAMVLLLAPLIPGTWWPGAWLATWWPLGTLSPWTLSASAAVVLSVSALLAMLSLSFEHYALTDRRLLLFRGVVARKSVQVRLSELVELAISTSVPQRVLGLGDIQALTAAPTVGGIMHCVRAPDGLAARIESQRHRSVRDEQLAVAGEVRASANS